MKLMGIKKNSEVSLLLTDDKEIQHLNNVYRNNDNPTDVLSFSMSEGLENFLIKDEMDEYLLGDIVISIETANRQAKEANQSLHYELAILLAHGLLHLLGFEHAKQKDYLRMKEEEEKIINIVKKELEL